MPAKCSHIINFLTIEQMKHINSKQTKSATSGIAQSQTVKCVGGVFLAVVYDNFSGCPIVVAFLGNRWWVVTPGEKVQPLEEYMATEDISFCFLCEAGGKVGALALARMLGLALANPEDRVDEVLRQRVKSLERLGVTLDVKDEPLLLEMEVFSNDGKPARQGNYSVMCHLHGNYFERIFDVDAFESKHDAEEWVGYYFDVLESLEIEFEIV